MGPNDGFGTEPTLATVGLNGLGGFGFFGAKAFRCVCVAGNGLMRLMPGTAFLSGSHSPSFRKASHSQKVGSCSMTYLCFWLPALNKKGQAATRPATLLPKWTYPLPCLKSFIHLSRSASIRLIGKCSHR